MTNKCIKCGCVDQENFYKNKRSRCKDCLREYKKKWAASTKQNKPRTKICEECNTTDINDFHNKHYNICKACHSSNVSVPYNCKDCGTTDPEVFKHTSKSLCYDCTKIYKLKHYHSKSPEEKLKSQHKKILWENENFYKHKMHSISSRSKNREFDIDIDADYIKELYVKQQGLCYISGRLMVEQTRQPNSVSVDRVDSDLGYTRDNVALCCLRINRMKSNNDNVSFIEFCKAVSKKTFDIGKLEYESSWGERVLTEEQKLKISKRVLYDNSRFYALLMESINGRAIKKNQEVSIDAAYIEALHSSQNGLCHYTGIEMVEKIKHFNSVSVDRVDSNIGYVDGNVVLCCNRINRMKSDNSTEDFLEWCKSVSENN